MSEEKRYIFDWCRECESVPDMEYKLERAIWCRECLRETMALKMGEVIKPSSYKGKEE